MKIVIIGSGAVGCGFIGQIAHASGYDVVFVDSDLKMVNQLNRAGCYEVQLVTGARTLEITVDKAKAIPITETGQVIMEIAEADLLATAVGARSLPGIAPLIAAGIMKRNLPLNILAFENLPNAGPLLRDLITRDLPKDFPSGRYGVSGAIVSRVVSRKEASGDKGEGPVFVGDLPGGFIVKGDDLCRPLPALRGIVFENQFKAYMTRKLCTFSAGHATCAYMGSLQGYRYIHQAIQDPHIRSVVLGAMTEGQHGLAARYGRSVAGSERQLHQILHRFENPALHDPISRVGRDPSRKLSSSERLVMAARLAKTAGVTPLNLSLGMGAAFHFYDKADGVSVGLQQEIELNGLETALPRISDIPSDSSLGRLVTESWASLGSPGKSMPVGKMVIV